PDSHPFHCGLDSVLRYVPRVPSIKRKRNFRVTPLDHTRLTVGRHRRGHRSISVLRRAAAAVGGSVSAVHGSSRLVALEAYQPFFMAAAIAFFGYAFHRLYREPEACAPGETCASSAMRQRQRVIFWVVALIAAALMAFP